jgi:ubiquinone/menaquinone biosynthesis C-methylase UbiE
MGASTATGRLTDLYGQMTSLERVLASLQRSGVDLERLTARDLYERDLDCQNLGAFRMLEVIAAVAAGRALPGAGDHMLDVGCGMGGPGRFLVERFGCSVTGIDLLPLRVETAEELTQRTGLAERMSYRVADATELPFDDGAFAQVWMLDVGIHVRDKLALFGELARVLRSGGLLVMHDQTGPLPAAMRPATRGAPFIAPRLTQLIRVVEGAGLRLLDWQDTTRQVVAYFERVREGLGPKPEGDASESPWRTFIRGTATAYLTTLDELGGRTGLLLAQRQPSS